MSATLNNGKVIIISAPSGAGKTSIVQTLLKKKLNLSFSVSACTRDKRPLEKEGEDYYFLSVSAFKKAIANDLFIEWEEVYNNQFYGTLKSEINRIWANNNHVIFDVDVKGGIALKNYFRSAALSIFIEPPTILELKNRLQKRGSDNMESINKRIAKAEYELSFKTNFDKLITNTVLENAAKETEDIIKEFLCLE